MSKTTSKENNENWNPLLNYEKINSEINKWANWKKKAYNEIFAVSAHAKKLKIE